MRERHWTTTSLLACAGLVITMANACGGSRGFACTQVAEPAVALQLRDAVTGNPVDGATAVLSDSIFQQVMVGVGDGRYFGGFERQGTYRVAVARAGYQLAFLADIVVPGTRCGPTTQAVEIQLVPQGTSWWSRLRPKAVSPCTPAGS
jgi:hypothetical protein